MCNDNKNIEEDNQWEDLYGYIDRDHVVTVDDIYAVWPHAIDYLASICNLETTAKEAREDILSLIGSKFDPRVGG